MEDESQRPEHDGNETADICDLYVQIRDAFAFYLSG